MKFDLLFLRERKSPWGGACAYVYVKELHGYGEDERDPRYGYHMLTSESMCERECHEQIDRLIGDLKKLKIKASQKFRKKNWISIRFHVDWKAVCRRQSCSHQPFRWRPAGFEELRILLLVVLREPVDEKELRQGAFDGACRRLGAGFAAGGFIRTAS